MELLFGSSKIMGSAENILDLLEVMKKDSPGNSRKEKPLIIFMIKRRNKREHRETTRADDTQRKNRTAIYCWFSHPDRPSEEFVQMVKEYKVGNVIYFSQCGFQRGTWEIKQI